MDLIGCVLWQWLAVLAAVGACVACAADVEALLQADFETNPRHTGWTARPGKEKRGAPAWTDEEVQSGAHCLTAADGSWLSPAFAVQPCEWYSLAFQSKAKGQGYWAAFFYDEKGNELAADCYASVYKSGKWQANQTCFRGRARTVQARLAFQPLERKRIWIDDVVVRPMGRRAAAEWADTLYATLPPLAWQPPPERGTLLPQAIEKLRTGRTLRIVMLGDSIINDTSNSPWDALLERAYPGARVEVVISVRGGTGCTYYKDGNRVQEYVLDYQPDLLIIGGISHGHDAEAIRSVVKQVRAASSAEIMVTTGAVANSRRCRSEFLKHTRLPQEQAVALTDGFIGRARAMAEEERCEFLDTRAIWDAYVKKAGESEDWFRRDVIHANDRGKQVLGRVLERYFAR